MDQAIERLRAVPEAQQERLAQFVLSELDEDDRWAASTEASASKLQGLSARILADHDAGKTEPLDPDRL